MPLDDFQIHPPSNGLRGDKRPFQAHTHQPPGTGICRKHESGLCVSVAMCGLPRGGILFEQENKIIARIVILRTSRTSTHILRYTTPPRFS